MSSSEEDLTSSRPITQTETIQAPAFKEPETTPGKLKLRSWLNKTLRIVMSDGRILMGEFNCTDRDANVILSMCSEYTEDGSEERLIGLAMVPGKHIVSIEIDVLGHNNLRDEITQMTFDDEKEDLASNEEVS